jgi:hypothetical protein
MVVFDFALVPPQRAADAPLGGYPSYSQSWFRPSRATWHVGFLAPFACARPGDEATLEDIEEGTRQSQSEGSPVGTSPVASHLVSLCTRCISLFLRPVLPLPIAAGHFRGPCYW